MSQTATFSDRKSRSTNRRWTPLNILLMVIGFVLFWPLGLGMLAWILWGDEISRMADDCKARFGSMSRSMPQSMSDTMHGRSYASAGTGNMAFDEYRARELERIEEERRKVEAMRTEFEDFLRDVRRAKDQEEFEKFMAAFEKQAGKSDKSSKKKNP